MTKVYCYSRGTIQAFAIDEDLGKTSSGIVN